MKNLRQSTQVKGSECSIFNAYIYCMERKKMWHCRFKLEITDVKMIEMVWLELSWMVCKIQVEFNFRTNHKFGNNLEVFFFLDEYTTEQWNWLKNSWSISIFVKSNKVWKQEDRFYMNWKVKHLLYARHKILRGFMITKVSKIL